MMKIRKYFLIIVLMPLAPMIGKGQNTLPGITIRNLNGHIIISWLNDYTQPISNISIQRSYDSSRHFITIGSVLNPMNKENGFSDNQPPYDRMFYRVLVTFEGGKYTYSEAGRPTVENISDHDAAIRYSWQYSPPAPEAFVEANSPAAVKKDSTPPVISTPKTKTVTSATPPPSQPQPSPSPALKTENTPAFISPKEAAYPSQRIFTSRENSVIISLPDAPSKKYSVRFYDESGREIISLGKISEDYLILEKVNFLHSGWFFFDLMEGNSMIEKNKLFIQKDIKIPEGGRNGKNK